MNALVTGGAGFIGSAVARALRDAGHQVGIAGTSSQSDSLTADRIAAIEPVDLIVHCAGGSSVRASLEDPEADYAKTVPPLELLLAHLRARMPNARLVLLSSAAVYGNAEQVPTTESCRLAPVSPYGVNKQRSEELCAAYSRDHGIATAVVRLFSVYGPGLRKQLLWDACRKARAGDVTFGGTGDEERDWLHVDDAAALVLRVAAQASARAPIFNGGSGLGIRVRDVVGQVCRELDAPTPHFTGVARAGDPSRYVADISHARSLGWSPQIEITRGISQYVAWFRQQR